MAENAKSRFYVRFDEDVHDDTFVVDVNVKREDLQHFIFMFRNSRGFFVRDEDGNFVCDETIDETDDISNWG